MEVKIHSEGQKIDVSLFSANTKGLHPAFVFFHGWGSRKNRHAERAEKIASLGITTLAVSFRGHGESTGEFKQFSRENHLQDALASFDYLASQPRVDPDRIGVFGSSYGGYISTMLSNERSVRYLALWDPALYRDENFSVPTALLIERDQNVFKQKDLNPEENKALKAISQFTGDLLIIRSELADVVPSATVDTYARLASHDHLTSSVIAGSDHPLTNPTHDQATLEVLFSWIKSRVVTLG